MILQKGSRFLNFFREWLHFDRFDEVSKDASFGLTTDLRSDMKAEIQMFVQNFVSGDYNAYELLTADYTYANNRLASYYGIPGPSTTSFMKVTLPANSGRAGLLTQGVILASTSGIKDTLTQPIMRGHFIVDDILCIPPNPPPDDIPSIEETSSGIINPTPKEALANHSKSAACIGCHQVMDPLGFSLENFNAGGKFRTTYASGKPVDAVGVLPDGTTFDGAKAMSQTLAARRNFADCISVKVANYAFGRVPSSGDKCAAQKAADTQITSNKSGKFSDLLFSIVNSNNFKQRRGIVPGGM